MTTEQSEDKPITRDFEDNVDINEEGHVRLNLANPDQHRSPEEIDELIHGLKWAADQGTFRQVDAYNKGDIIYVDERKYRVEKRSASRFGEYGAAIVWYGADHLNRPKDEFALPCRIQHGEVTHAERQEKVETTDR